MTGADKPLEALIAAAEAARNGPPPLAPFGLVLHHDGTWTHEGQPIRHRRLREQFDRSVVYLPSEGVYVVQIGRFRGQIELEEAGFFVRSVDLEAGTVHLSDNSDEPLAPATLELSPIDGALLCRVKHHLTPEGLPARFSHAAQAELLAAVEEQGEQLVLRVAGENVAMPEL